MHTERHGLTCKYDHKLDSSEVVTILNAMVCCPQHIRVQDEVVEYLVLAQSMNTFTGILDDVH